MINKFKESMINSGINPPDNVYPDGVLHRFKINGKSCGWYVLHGGDYWAGVFGDWSKDIKIKWRQDDNVKRVFTDDMRKKIELDKLERFNKEKKDRELAAIKANYLWDMSLFPLEFNHKYCVSKNIRTIGARIDNDVLLIPIYNIERKLVNLQFIAEDGTKRFLKNGEKKGCFFELEGDYKTILICEGYATGVSLYDTYGCTVIVSFDAGNLIPVAINIGKLCPYSEVIIAADNDESGIGKKKAIEACMAYNFSYIIPDETGKDWNDVLSKNNKGL